jgi:hypothetical protein
LLSIRQDRLRPRQRQSPTMSQLIGTLAMAIIILRILMLGRLGTRSISTTLMSLVPVIFARVLSNTINNMTGVMGSIKATTMKGIVGIRSTNGIKELRGTINIRIIKDTRHIRSIWVIMEVSLLHMTPHILLLAPLATLILNQGQTHNPLLAMRGEGTSTKTFIISLSPNLNPSRSRCQAGMLNGKISFLPSLT